MGRGARTAAGFAWAAVPLVSLGMATAPAFLYPAVRRRRAADWAAFAVYLALTVFVMVTLEADEESLASSLSFVAFLLLWAGGTVHALAIRSRVFGTRRGDHYQKAVSMVAHRHELRAAARETARDPAAAWELRIGRPDLPRGFDDGGLVDVNHAPPAVLASLPGMTPDLVDRIVRTREQVGGFVSAEELSALAQLPPDLTEPLEEFAIFL